MIKSLTSVAGTRGHRRRLAISSAVAISALMMVVGMTLALANAAESGSPAAAKHHPKKHPSTKPHKVIVPKSSIEKPGDVGQRAHTNYEILDTHGPVKLQARPDTTK